MNDPFATLDDETRATLLEKGKKRIDWAMVHMEVLEQIGKRILNSGNLKDIRVSMALHTEAKTAVLAVVLARSGAHVRLASCNPLTTDDSVALAISGVDVSPGTLEVRARYDQDKGEYYDALNWTLDQGPQIVIDDGGDLIRILHTERRELLDGIMGGCEETTTGIIRLKALQNEGKLMFPVMDVNNADMKHLFDNRYGTGQSTLDGILSATNLTVAGMRAVVAGYGWCGKGISMRLKGMGANITVTEIDPVKGVEAVMDGFRVLPMEEACLDANLIITATGCKDVVPRQVIDKLPDGCMLANSGHFDNEIDTAYLEEHESSEARSEVTAYDINGRTVYLLSRGRLVNLVAGQGHPVEIMDMSFAMQALGCELIVRKASELPADVIPFPHDLDDEVARIKLSSIGYSIDELTDEQRIYLGSWEHGT